jgi:branched-subunit amino acid aminotransferase/4-amino-4-deoxychorismate lyase
MARWMVDGVVGGGVPGNDQGLVRGLNAFETLRTYGRVPFRLAEHIERLTHSAGALAIPMPAREVVEREIAAVIDGQDLWVRYLLTGGGHRVVESGPLDLAGVGRPVSVATITWEPSPWLPGSVKHSSRAGWETAAREQGVDEVIFVDRNGRILEAGRSNVFAVVDGALWTPPADGRILAGVTRAAMIEAAREAGLNLRIEELPGAIHFDELYVSSTMKELAPAVIDGVIRRGPVGEALHAAFRRIVARECGR